MRNLRTSVLAAAALVFLLAAGNVASAQTVGGPASDAGTPSITSNPPDGGRIHATSNANESTASSPKTKPDHSSMAPKATGQKNQSGGGTQGHNGANNRNGQGTTAFGIPSMDDEGAGYGHGPSGDMNQTTTPDTTRGNPPSNETDSQDHTNAIIQQAVKNQVTAAVTSQTQTYDQILKVLFWMILVAVMASVAAVVLLLLDRNHVMSKVEEYYNKLTQIAMIANLKGDSADGLNDVVNFLDHVNKSVERLNTRLGSGTIASVQSSQRPGQSRVYLRDGNHSSDLMESRSSILRSSAVEIFNQYYPNTQIYEELKKQFSYVGSVSCINLDDKRRPGGILRFEESVRGNYIVVNDPALGFVLLPRADTDLMSSTTLEGIFLWSKVGAAAPSLAHAAVLQQTAPAQYQLVKPGQINV